MQDISALERKIGLLEADVRAHHTILVDAIEQRDSFLLESVWGLVPGDSHMVTSLWLGFAVLCLTDWNETYILIGSIISSWAFWWLAFLKKEKLQRLDLGKLRPLPSWKACRIDD